MLTANASNSATAATQLESLMILLNLSSKPSLNWLVLNFGLVSYVVRISKVTEKLEGSNVKRVKTHDSYFLGP